MFTERVGSKALTRSDEPDALKFLDRPRLRRV
jgi:hypothetical protein